ncbi:MAG: hypothetical protein M0P12_00580 [Paludibacteraceae bacterium]|nr:hypothetical protein [Paludibacteraceae bacterium]
MNKTEYLLACLSEECAEVQKNVGKALRFGLDDIDPNTKLGTNGELILEEFYHICAVVELLQEDGIIRKPSGYWKREMENDKKKRVTKFMEYSKQKGTLK